MPAHCISWREKKKSRHLYTQIFECLLDPFNELVFEHPRPPDVGGVACDGLALLIAEHLRPAVAAVVRQDGHPTVSMLLPAGVVWRGQAGRRVVVEDGPGRAGAHDGLPLKPRVLGDLSAAHMAQDVEIVHALMYDHQIYHFEISAA